MSKERFIPLSKVQDFMDHRSRGKKYFYDTEKKDLVNAKTRERVSLTREEIEGRTDVKKTVLDKNKDTG